MGQTMSEKVVNNVTQYVDDAIASKKVVVFSKTYCPYCVNAKRVLTSYNLGDEDLLVIELEKIPNHREIQGYLKQLTGASTVPRIFINGKSVGGNDDLVRIHESGHLKTAIEE